MVRFDVGNAVTIQIDYVDDNGIDLTPTAVSYSILDENDNILADDIVVSGPWGSPQSVVIPAGYNAPAGGRKILFQVTTADGTTYIDTMYQLRDQATRLVLLTNTFQTYLQAQLTANDMVNLTGWACASEDQHIAAMTEAYFRLTRFGYLIKWPEYVDTQNIYLQDIHARITPQMWPVMTPILFAPYPVQFQAALKKAQVVEANSILTGDPIGDKRRLGLLAESVGESKVMFRSGVRPLDFGIARETLEVIKTYLDYRFTLTRAP